MITLRLDPQTELLLKSTAEHLGLSRTELIRQSILDYLSRNTAPSAWETGKELFGKYSSGCGDLSARRKELVKEKLLAQVQKLSWNIRKLFQNLPKQPTAE